YLQLGLAGHADAEKNGGNGDQRVSLRELEHYVTDRVNRWAVANRGCRQEPLLLHDGADFELATALNSATQSRLKAALVDAKPASDGMRLVQLEAVWRSFEQLCSDGEFLRLCPREHGLLRRQLLRLEQFANAGNAYTLRAKTLLDSIQIRIDRIARARSATPEWHRSLVHHWSAFQSQPTSLPHVQPHDLAIAAYLGVADSQEVSKLRADLSAQAGGRAVLTRNDLRDEASFFEILRRYQVADRWADDRAIEQVLQLRNRANVLAVPFSPTTQQPGDERAHDWVRVALDSADDKRRLAQDYLLAGESVGKQAVSEHTTAATKLFDHAEATLRLAAQAYSHRDTISADLPFIAQWLMDPTTYANHHAVDAGTNPPDHERLTSAISDAIESIVELSLQLSGPTAANEDASNTQFLEVQQQLRRLLASNGIGASSWQQVVDFKELQLQRLLNMDPSPTLARQIESFILLPTISADNRAKLLARRGELFARLHEDYFHGNSDTATINETEVIADNSEFVAYLSNQGINPLSRLVQSELPVAGGESAEAASNSNSVRNHLRSIQQADVKRVIENETLERLTAALWYPRPELDPVAARRLHDLSRWLTWRCERSLRDYLGPVQTGGRPAFAIAAQDYRDGANRFAVVQGSASSEPFINSAIERAAEVVSLQATRQNETDNSISVLASIDETNTKLPVHGIASLLFESPKDSKISDALPERADVRPVAPFPGESTSLQLSAPVSATQLLAVFRGNEVRRDFANRQERGVRIVATLAQNEDTTVTVQRVHANLSLLLLIDGSSSMRESNKNEKRIEKTKQAVNTLLQQLTNQSGVRCGVCFYGHRVGYDIESESQHIRIHPAYIGQIPDGLRPEDDVETVLPLGQFREFDAASVRQEMTKLTGWGQSPHYRALLSALQAFPADGSSRQAIVFFTDGDDMSPTSNESRRLETIGWSEVVSLARQSGIPIHVVSPGPSDPGDQNALQELEAASGGTFRTSERISTLLPAILSRSEADEFVVSGTTRSPERNAAVVSDITTEVATGDSNLQTAEVLTTQLVNQPALISRSHAYRNLTVSAGNTRQEFPIQGGENIELLMDNETNRFTVPKYRQSFAREIPFVNESGQPLSASAFVHRPERSGDLVTFKISLQQANQQYVPRPKLAWIEITPTGNQAYQPFVFYDSVYVSDAPVPVLQCTTPDWPQDAGQARLRMWVLTNGSYPSRDVQVNDLFDAKFTHTGNDSSVKFHGNSLTTEPNGIVTLVITETHDKSSTKFGQLMVRAISETPHAVEHRYDADRRLVTHRFSYRGVTLDRLKASTLHVSDRSDIEKVSWRTNESEYSVFNVPLNDDVIQIR
ncbi:MAG: VWA domain-containing protein, partial [Planctomycetales bacterium]|nr:VWA domain-containing protein [Planctomycetales bacterium]